MIEYSAVLLEGRQTQVENRQKTYTWKNYDSIGLPSSIDTEKDSLPHDERFDKCKEENFLGNSFKGLFYGLESGILKIVSELLSKIFGNRTEHLKNLENFQGFYEIAKSVQKEENKSDVDKYDIYSGPFVPYDLARWTSDVEFGRQILNGVNCVVVKRCIELPSNFPVTQEMVKHSLVRSGDLKNEMEVLFIFISLLESRHNSRTCPLTINPGYLILFSLIITKFVKI